MDDQLDGKTLSHMLSAMAKAFTDERKKSEPYKEMFKAGSTHTGLLRDLESKMTGHILDACEVYKERHGVAINRDQYHILMALPLMVKLAEKDAEQNEGTACCVDKAYFLLSEQINKLGDNSK